MAKFTAILFFTALFMFCPFARILRLRRKMNIKATFQQKICGLLNEKNLKRRMRRIIFKTNQLLVVSTYVQKQTGYRLKGSSG